MPSFPGVQLYFLSILYRSHGNDFYQVRKDRRHVKKQAIKKRLACVFLAFKIVSNIIIAETKKARDKPIKSS